MVLWYWCAHRVFFHQLQCVHPYSTELLLEVMNTYDAFPKALCLYTCQGIVIISKHIQTSEVDCMKIVHEHTSNIDPVIGAFLLQVVLFYRQ